MVSPAKPIEGSRPPSFVWACPENPEHGEAPPRLAPPLLILGSPTLMRGDLVTWNGLTTLSRAWIHWCSESLQGRWMYNQP